MSMAVERVAGAVVAHRGVGVCVRGRFLVMLKWQGAAKRSCGLGLRVRAAGDRKQLTCRDAARGRLGSSQH